MAEKPEVIRHAEAPALAEEDSMAVAAVDSTAAADIDKGHEELMIADW
jgi:hypothetical protein